MKDQVTVQGLTSLSIHPSIHPSIHLSFHLSLYLSISLSLSLSLSSPYSKEGAGLRMKGSALHLFLVRPLVFEYLCLSLGQLCSSILLTTIRIGLLLFHRFEGLLELFVQGLGFRDLCLHFFPSLSLNLYPLFHKCHQSYYLKHQISDPTLQTRNPQPPTHQPHLIQLRLHNTPPALQRCRRGHSLRKLGPGFIGCFFGILVGMRCRGWDQLCAPFGTHFRFFSREPCHAV